MSNDQVMALANNWDNQISDVLMVSYKLEDDNRALFPLRYCTEHDSHCCGSWDGEQQKST